MTLNEIFRQTGEPTYFTPIGVMAEVMTADESKAIGNPPFTTNE